MEKNDSVIALWCDQRLKTARQLSMVLLVRAGGMFHAFAHLALNEKRAHIYKYLGDPVAQLPEGDGAEDSASICKILISRWVGVALEDTQPCAIATNIGFILPGVLVEKFGDGWQPDWKKQGQLIFRDCLPRISFESRLLSHQVNCFSSGDDLLDCFYAALWLARREKFFEASFEDRATAEEHKILKDAGAHSVGSYSDIRRIGR